MLTPYTKNVKSFPVLVPKILPDFRSIFEKIAFHMTDQNVTSISHHTKT